MLTKKEFKQIINLILEGEKREEKFSSALEEYSPYGHIYWHDPFYDKILDWLLEVMNDDTEDSTILWWLYDCPNRGKNTEHCQVWDLDDNLIADIRTLDDLYDYLIKSYNTEKESK